MAFLVCLGVWSSGTANAWNNWIVGALIICILAAIRLGSPPFMSWVSWINCALGVWTFASPWIYGYTGNTDRFANSLVVGVIVFVFAICSATALPRMAHQGRTGRDVTSHMKCLRLAYTERITISSDTSRLRTFMRLIKRLHVMDS